MLIIVNDKLVYMDNAATTMMFPEVLDSMLPWFKMQCGNPSSVYECAADGRNAINEARRIIAKTLQANDNEIYFTSGGSESDNWALKGIAEEYKWKGNHIITSKIEHHAVLNTCKYLEEKGFSITYLDVDSDGRIDINQLREAITPKTILISIMTANNEIGTIEPIEEIGKIAKEKSVLFHTDAVQAYGHINIDVQKTNIDLLSASGHKIGGPKGIGFLYIRNKVKMGSLIHGGNQEYGKRAGTENVPAIVGLGKASEIVCHNLINTCTIEKQVRDYLIEKVKNNIPFVTVNGSLKYRLTNNANFSFRFVNGDALVNLLGKKGICVSAGSACTAGEIESSHVLLAISSTKDDIEGTIRMTISKKTTKKDIDYVVQNMKIIIEKMRSLSSEYRKIIDKEG